MDVRFFDVRQVRESQIRQWSQWLTQEERQRMARYDAPLPHLCARGLAREMLAQVLHLAPEEICFAYGGQGKPLVEGAYFNLSHSGALVLCAVSTHPVGVDVEQLRPVMPHLARRFGTDDPTVFFRRWTETEARLKCCGASVGAWRRFTQPIEGLTVTQLAAPAGYAAAVCEQQD